MIKTILRLTVLLASMMMVGFWVAGTLWADELNRFIGAQQLLDGLGVFQLFCFTVHACGFLVSILMLIPKSTRSAGHDFRHWLMRPVHTFHGERKGRKLWKWLTTPGCFSAYSLLWGFSFILILLGGSIQEIPEEAAFHTADDLYRVTGVEFPELIAVDSAYFDNFAVSENSVKFVPKDKLKKSFFRRLDRACREDTCCWTKNEQGYSYRILPAKNLDRRKDPKAAHWRMVEMDGTMVPDWDGSEINVTIPIKGDTITAIDGWYR